MSVLRFLMFVLTFAAVPAAVSVAQVEVIPADRAAEYRRRLPEAIETAPDGLKPYLRSLQQRDGVEADRAIASAVRAAADARGQTGLFTYYAVPALSNLMRLPDAYPIDGTLGGTVGIVAARDEYEPASFVIHPLADAENVELVVSDLTTADGAVFPRANLDLKVVKVWYQNGNAWFSYFSDVGLTLVPELLLHDEKLIRVDEQKVANYARVGDGEVWISAPRKADAPFDPYADGFADAKTLQPVSLSAGRFKQFVLTAHVPADAKPGLYRGQIEVKSAGRVAGQIPVALRVLPFTLPSPKSGVDPKKDFIVSLMGAWPRVSPDHKAFRPTLQNLRRHNLLHIVPNVKPGMPDAEVVKQLSAMREAGFADRPIIGGGLPWVGTHDGTPYTYDELMKIQHAAEAWKAFALKYYGHTDVVIGLGDEQTAPWVVKARTVWRIVHEQGLKTGLAGHGHIFTKGGFMLDFHPTAGSPSDADHARPWNELGHAHVSFYASQHNGSENPDFVRRQHGLLGWLSGYDMVNNYEFAYGPWNDRASELYKPMVLAYPTSEGLVDTLAWEGFREGIDDIRYATLLKQLATEAIDSGELDRVYAGRQVRMWFAEMDGEQVDLSAVRMEMIEKIERLLKQGK